MFFKQHQEDQATVPEFTTDARELLFVEAYCYSLELCDDPAIARAVASRFIGNVQPEPDTVETRRSSL